MNHADLMSILARTNKTAQKAKLMPPANEVCPLHHLKRANLGASNLDMEGQRRLGNQRSRKHRFGRRRWFEKIASQSEFRGYTCSPAEGVEQRTSTHIHEHQFEGAVFRFPMLEDETGIELSTSRLLCQ